MRLFLYVLIVAAFAGLCAAPALPGPPTPQPDKNQPNAERVKGMKAAIADIEAGKLKQRSGALPDPPWHRRYIELLNEECGVEWKTITDKPTAKLIAEMGGYNDVMRVEIEDRYGRGILDKLSKKAEAEYRKATEKQ
jgi:hypothetical protein